jgi:penicillin-binding protein 1A
VLLLAFVAGALLVVAVATFYNVRAGRVDLFVVRDMPQTTVIYDMHGRPIHRFFSQNRVLMPEGKVPFPLREAIVSTEDRRFFEHHGFDAWGIVRAAISNLIGHGNLQGASTITQQLARNSIGRLERTLDRKLLELALARRIEKAYSKEEILRHYLDRIYYGRGLYGAETAARAFYGKTVGQLSLGEAALLAGMVSAPNRFSPWTDVEAALRARNRALKRMAKAGFITKAQREAAQAEQLALRPRPEEKGNYFADEIRKVLAPYVSEEELLEGGLKIFSTLDQDLQSVATSTVRDQVEAIESSAEARKGGAGSALEGAMIILDTGSGAIRAMVGGRDYATSEFNRATQARRQVGSLLKPFVYGAVFEALGYSPATWVDTTPFDLTHPDTASASSGHSFLRVNEALARSDNYAAMRMGQLVGPGSVITFLRQCGVWSSLKAFPSLFLGACELSLVEVTSAYATLGAGGVWHEPFLVVQVQDAEGRVLFQRQPAARVAMSPEVARQVLGMMEAVMDWGTGAPVRTKFGVSGPAAGKTGTTNDYRDAWFMGLTSQLTGGVWVGADQPRTIASSGYGGRLALPIWGTVFRAAEQRYPPAPFAVPTGLELVELDAGILSKYRAQTVWLRPDQRWQAGTRQDDVPAGEPPPVKRSRSWLDRLLSR